MSTTKRRFLVEAVHAGHVTASYRDAVSAEDAAQQASRGFYAGLSVIDAGHGTDIRGKYRRFTTGHPCRLNIRVREM